MNRTLAVLAGLIFVCSVAVAADKVEEKKAPKDPVIVVLKSGERIELTTIEIGVEEDGLLGKTFRKFRKLPIQLEKLKLEVPFDNLQRIEIMQISEDGKKMQLRMTAADGKAIEGTLYAETKLILRGVHPFADAEAVLDPTTISEIILKPAKT